MCEKIGIYIFIIAIYISGYDMIIALRILEFVLHQRKMKICYKYVRIWQYAACRVSLNLPVCSQIYIRCRDTENSSSRSISYKDDHWNRGDLQRNA